MNPIGIAWPGHSQAKLFKVRKGKEVRPGQLVTEDDVRPLTRLERAWYRFYTHARTFLAGLHPWLRLVHLFHELTGYRWCKWMKKSKDYDLVCERCFSYDIILYKSHKDSEGMDYIYEDSDEPIPKERRVPIWVCRRCQHELMNGGGMREDPVEIDYRRQEEDYEYDPINNDPPEGWGEWQ